MPQKVKEEGIVDKTVLLFTPQTSSLGRASDMKLHEERIRDRNC